VRKEYKVLTYDTNKIHIRDGQYKLIGLQSTQSSKAMKSSVGNVADSVAGQVETL